MYETNEKTEKLVVKNATFITWDRIHPGMVGSVIIAKAFLREIGFERGR